MLKQKTKEKYLLAFLLGFGLIMVILLPQLIYNKGIFLYYGDFNSQQIPFYQLAHRAVRNGDLFWNWNTDLGSDMMGTYSFYLWGSPFFWFSTLFPTSWVIYLMPILLALKFAFASLTGYAFIRRFVRTPNAALIGALLYAYSGFQAYNVFFNHFHDVVAFFPLLLIALEERVNNNRRGVFALAVALMAVINYFFFAGQVVFLIIYFIIRCTCKDFNITFRKFLSICFEAILGIMIACFMFLPSAIAVANNPRLQENLTGLNMVVYNDKFRIIRILQSFFMIPDVPARPNLFSADTGKWASIAGYLPIFSMAGVLSFMKQKRNHWATKLTVVCMIMAFIPILNSAFAAFNASYYARWFYMPILILALMSAYSVDNRKINMKFGFIFSSLFIVAFFLVALLPKKVDEKNVYLKITEYPDIFWVSMFVTLACTTSLFILLYFIRRKNFMKVALIMTICGCYVATATIVYIGMSLGPYPHVYINQAIYGGEKVNIPEEENQFYRIDMSENTDNYPMIWGIPTMRCFNSSVSPSIMSFYQSMGLERDVATRIETSHYALRGLLSVKYYFHNEDNNRTFKMPGFEYYDNQNGYNIYENKYYVPMGFTFDYYITQKSFEDISTAQKDNVYMRALLLTDKQIEKYGDIISELPNESLYISTESQYQKDCEERKAQSCYYFNETTKGFTAKINLQKDNLVFFSVPFDNGFKAYVDGKLVEIENVDNGMMAIKVPAGNHDIEFKYMTFGLVEGVILTLIGLVILSAYVVIFRKTDKSKTKKFTHCYDYDIPIEISARNEYEASLLNLTHKSADDSKE